MTPVSEPALILLPPSEGKATGGAGPVWTPDSIVAPALDPSRLTALAGLRSAMRSNAAERAKLLGVKGDALAAATAANRAAAEGPTMPAIDRYTGVLYGELDHATLDADASDRLGRCVLIVSALWGLVAPQDAIPDYKLKMSASLARTGRLSTWWRPALTEAVAGRIAGRRLGEGVAPLVWNLLPNEHAAAVQLPAGTESVSARFVEQRSDGSLVAVAHWNKLHKGSLVRHLVTEGLSRPEELNEWTSEHGFRLDSSLTVTDGTHRTLSFVRAG